METKNTEQPTQEQVLPHYKVFAVSDPKPEDATITVIEPAIDGAAKRIGLLMPASANIVETLTDALTDEVIGELRQKIRVSIKAAIEGEMIGIQERLAQMVRGALNLAPTAPDSPRRGSAEFVMPNATPKNSGAVPNKGGFRRCNAEDDCKNPSAGPRNFNMCREHAALEKEKRKNNTHEALQKDAADSENPPLF